MLGVLLDTRPATRRLPATARLDLVRGAMAFRWRTRLPFLAPGGGPAARGHH